MYIYIVKGWRHSQKVVEFQEDLTTLHVYIASSNIIDCQKCLVSDFMEMATKVYPQFWREKLFLNLFWSCLRQG